MLNGILLSRSEGHDRHHLTVTAKCLRECALHRRDFVLASHELRQPAPRRKLKMRPQRSDTGHLVTCP
jgi:hypothetical protein